MPVAEFVVQTANQRYESRQRAIPEPHDHGAVLRVEACGICGSEVELLLGHLPEVQLPIAPGHEVVGRIEKIGNAARREWGVDLDDRVVLMSALRCGRCRGCIAGDPCTEVVEGEPGSYGWRDPDIDPGLWGGFATHMWLAPGSVVIPIANEVPLEEAVLFNPLANGFEWVVGISAIKALDRVAVLGCGPQGLGCLLAAQEAGASEVVVTGIAGDEMRLDMAERLGATAAVDVTGGLAADFVQTHFTGSPDLVIDTTPSPETVSEAVTMVRLCGSIVVSGFKRGPVRLSESVIHSLVSRAVKIRGARSKSLDSLRRAVQLIERRTDGFEGMSTDAFPLSEAQLAVEVFGGLYDGVRRPHVRIEPG